MRDLGGMAENTFATWCAEVGLVANSSKIDKTGWDYYIEFPSPSVTGTTDIHRSALECKVQVKATDGKDRKLPVKLSNLRRLVTAPMPAFFVFMEFDKLNTVQEAFVVHVDTTLVYKVLKRIREISQNDQINRLNKRFMTIHYGEPHMLSSLDGRGLVEALEDHIGDDMAQYIEKKRGHLESAGFEHGAAEVTFRTNEESLEKMIDMSLGLGDPVGISYFKASETRFGIPSRSPLVESKEGKVSIPDLEPAARGTFRLRESKISAGLVFDIKVYASPFNISLPKERQKIRVEGDFFDFLLRPHTGEASSSFYLGGGKRLDLAKFWSALKLISIFESNMPIIADMDLDQGVQYSFEIKANEGLGYDYSQYIDTLERSLRLASRFGVSEPIDISLDEIEKYGAQIRQFEGMLNADANLFRVEFDIHEGKLDLERRVACVVLVSAPIGSHIFGAVFVIVGKASETEYNRYKLSIEDVSFEKRMISRFDEPIRSEDIAEVVEDIESRYAEEYSVVKLFS